jgi:hypothetical protein
MTEYRETTGSDFSSEARSPCSGFSVAIGDVRHASADDRIIADALVASDDLWIREAVVTCGARGWVVHAQRGHAHMASASMADEARR